MAKKKIKQDEFWIAYNYLKRKLRENVSFPQEEAKLRIKAEKSFEKIEADEKSCGELLKWCEAYLPDDDWVRLRNTIRAKRKRVNDFQKDDTNKNITVSHQAWLMITEIAKYEKVITRRKGVTLSEVIKKHLKEVHTKALRFENVCEDVHQEIVRCTQSTNEPLSVKKLRSFIRYPKDECDKALLHLVKENQVFLYRRKLPSKVTKKDQALLITDGKDYYNNVGIR